MIPVAIYLLKVSLCSSLLFACYYTFLRNRYHHRWNRFFLLGTVFFSILAPLLRIPFPRNQIAESANFYKLLSITHNAEYFDPTNPVINNGLISVNTIIILLYGLISLLLLVTLLVSILKISSLAKRSPKFSKQGYYLLSAQAENTPFSFFNYLFWNSRIDLESSTGRRILRHELTHIYDRHSWDRLFLRLVLVVFWINPFFWMIQKELIHVHEFIADWESVSDGDTSAFADMVLASSFGTEKFNIASSFFQPSIKRRIQMLTIMKTKRKSYFSRLVSLPLSAIFMLAFSLPTRQGFNNSVRSNLDNPFVVVIDAGHGGSDAGATGADGTAEKKINLAIAQKVKELNQDENLKIYLTRGSDESLSVKDRTAFAITKNPSAFISIHINAAPSESKTGFDIFIPGKNESNKNNNILLGSILANQLEPHFTTDQKLKSRENQGIWVLDAPEINYPRVLLHCGYMSNPGDVSMLLQEKKQSQIAMDILEAIKKFAAAEKNQK